MRKDITIEKIMLGGDFVNKSALARQYGCCWETIDRRLNPDKYKFEYVDTIKEKFVDRDIVSNEFVTIYKIINNVNISSCPNKA